MASLLSDFTLMVMLLDLAIQSGQERMSLPHEHPQWFLPSLKGEPLVLGKLLSMTWHPGGTQCFVLFEPSLFHFVRVNGLTKLIRPMFFLHF